MGLVDRGKRRTVLVHRPPRRSILDPLAAAPATKMSVMDPIGTSFAPLLGQPSWLVRQGHGSFVTMEFGDPELEVK